MSVHVETDPSYILARPLRRRLLAATPVFLYGEPEQLSRPAELLEPMLPSWMPPNERRSRRGGRQVAVAPIARAVQAQVERSGDHWIRLAERLGWYYGAGADARGDGTRVLRRLGLAKSPQSRGYPPKQSRYIDRELAAEIVRAAGLDPVDVEL